MDNNKTTFRNKVKSKFNLQHARPQVNNKEKETAKPTFVFLLPLPIPAKSQKKVKKLLKYFKKNDKPLQKNSYAQASSQSKQANSSSLSSVAINIKKMFLNFPNKKIDMVQKVINGNNSKPKPRINMTMKSSSHKQVIVLMNNELAKNLLKDSSMHVTNINHALKNILLNTIADFICTDDKGIVITTNNVSSLSDLQEIKRYIKSALFTDVEQVSFLKLLQSKLYLKIVDISYISEKTNVQISSNEIENILKSNYISKLWPYPTWVRP